MNRPLIALAALGGTICMTPRPSGDPAPSATDQASKPASPASSGPPTPTEPNRGGVVPSLSAHDLIAAVPALAEHARLQAETLFSLPSSAIDFEILQSVLAWAKVQVEAGAAGVVITQGTDSLEESAFFLDLYWPYPEPLVLTGAMRSPLMAGADGPANLLAAVLAASHPESRQRGVLVVMNDTLHAARRVRKMHTLAVQAFESPNGGPLACLVEGQWRWWQQSSSRPPILAPARLEARVALLETCLGDEGELLEGVQAAGFHGLVLGGFGTGHVAPRFADKLDAICQKIPVAMASRTGAGHTTRCTYGAPGSEIDLQRRGVMMAEDLDPRKARLLLRGLLAAGLTGGELRAAWQNWLQR